MQLDPVKSKKRYLILTYLEKYNVNDSSDRIKEEIAAENQKTHYPMPLNMVELKTFNNIKEQKITAK
jgi:hypothetical protein